jgi:hypothetical protein
MVSNKCLSHHPPAITILPPPTALNCTFRTFLVPNTMSFPKSPPSHYSRYTFIVITLITIFWLKTVWKICTTCDYHVLTTNNWQLITATPDRSIPLPPLLGTWLATTGQSHYHHCLVLDLPLHGISTIANYISVHQSHADSDLFILSHRPQHQMDGGRGFFLPLNQEHPECTSTQYPSTVICLCIIHYQFDKLRMNSTTNNSGSRLKLVFWTEDDEKWL